MSMNATDEIEYNMQILLCYFDDMDLKCTTVTCVILKAISKEQGSISQACFNLKFYFVVDLKFDTKKCLFDETSLEQKEIKC